MIGNGAAFTALCSGDHRQLTVVQAEDGYVYVTAIVEERSILFVATDEQAKAIAKALNEATKR